MSSPGSAGGANASVAVREGTRVILREITANLQNSTAAQSTRRKSGNEATTIKGDQQPQQQQQQQQQQPQQHDVKVRFIREFADAGAPSSVREAANNTESSLSSASSFQSLTSTLSSKCSSGICVDSSPARASDTSYLSADIPGLDDLISACENIRLEDSSKILDQSKDQSFSLQLDAEDLDSGDQTFTSAIDRDSPDRTRDISADNSPVDFRPNATRDLDGDQETSTANAYFECATVDVVEAAPFDQANSELDTVDESFVQCVSNLAQIESAAETHDALGNADAAKNRENLGIGGATLSLDEFAGNSTSTLETLTDLIVEGTATQLRDIEEPAPAALNVTVDAPGDLKETLGQSEVSEKPTQSVLDVTVDFTKGSEEIETVASKENEVTDEKSTQSVLDVTVDFSSDPKDVGNVASGTSEVPEKPGQPVLDVTVDFSSDPKDVGSVASGTSEVPEKPGQPLLDDTVDFTSDLRDSEIVRSKSDDVADKPTSSTLDVTVDLKSDLRESEIVEPRPSEVAENPVQSALDVTVDFPSDPKEIETEFFGKGVEEPAQSVLDTTVDLKELLPGESLSDLIVNVPTGENYEFNEESQCPSLPTLSSVCLRTTLAESDAQIAKQRIESPPSTEYTVPTLAAPSLSEKFANIAAKDISPNSSISNIKEPTFLNAQKLVEDSIDLGEDTASAAKSESAIIGGTSNPDREYVANLENLVQQAQSEFFEFKKPQVPGEIAATKVSSPIKSPSKENGGVDSVEAKKQQQVVQEIVENREANCSSGSDDLNETVTIQDISAGNIFAAAESDQYAEFLPVQQSTALTLDRSPTLNANKFPSVAVAGSISGDNNSVTKPLSLPDDEYAAFVPQQQSTSLACFAERPLEGLVRQPTPFVTAGPPPVEATFNGENNRSPKPALPVDDRCNFEKLELAAKAVANDIYNTSLELEDDTGGRFVSASSDLFYDPGSFDFLLSKTPRKNTRRDLRAESLYVKFDPLVSNTSMLPQGNIQNASPPVNEERNGDNNTTIANIGTPKRSSAIAAIDKLLFYSPMTTTTTTTSNTASIQKTNDSQEKAEPTEETGPETVNMAKELELVRSTVLQLEEQLEKLKIDHDEALGKQSSYQEKINQLQTQLAQEIKNKNQITVVVDEYEKSISRLVAERERDRKNLDLEKAKLQEELAATKHHLDNTEAAFNDVHLKYERLKAVVSTYKNNEVMLKQSIQENVEIIKSLENRYEQVKEHATARLEKANQDLDAIRKQNESETVRLQAMLRKAELKSNSLAELVEQKTKENKELTQILDEVIARVGRKQPE